MIFVLCVLIHDMTAWDLLDGACKRKGKDVIEILNVFEMMLCLDAWTKGSEYWKLSEATVEEDRARTAIGVVIDSIKTHLPRPNGNNWNLPNLHALLHYPRDITRFGPPNEYTTWFMESGHKHHVKLPGRTVAKVKGRFDHGLALSVRSQNELKMFLHCANVQTGVIDIMSDEETETEHNGNGEQEKGSDGTNNISMEEVNDEDVDKYDSVGSSEDEEELEDLLTVEDGIRDVPVLDYVKSKPELRRMLMYSTRYVVRSTLDNHGGVQVKVDWFTRSYHRHVIDDSVAQCLVVQHGAMEIGIEEDILFY